MPPETSDSSQSSSNNSRDNPFDDRHALPLQDMTTLRLSSETQRRNGFPQSTAPTLQARIIEDIRNGNKPCCICMEALSFGEGHLLWHCKTCYTVAHFSCATTWSSSNTSGVSFIWRCPQCSMMKTLRPQGKCWCSKGTPLHDHPITPNSCIDGICDNESRCAHGNKSNCRKSCHPGPCEFACGTCRNDPVPIPPNLNTVWGRLRNAKLNFATILRDILLFSVISAGIITYIFFHIKWHTQPYLFPKFKEWYGQPLSYLLGVAGVFYAMLCGALFFYYAMKVMKFSQGIILGRAERYSRSQHWMLLLCNISTVLVFLGIFVSPIIGIIAGPKIQWNNQMKDSCEYFDTRVSMGTLFPESQYDIRSLDQSVHGQTFFLAPVFAPQAVITAKYQYYHRFSGNSANTAHLAIDVDLENAVWRMMELDGPDKRTKWAAVGRKRDNAFLPAFENVNQTERLNGTIEQRGPHIWIPEWEMLIQGIDDARQHCEIEPFIRVFDVQGAPKNYTESLMQPQWNWSPEWDEYLMMRTASFGLGRQRLDMCIKENNFRTLESQEDKYKGVSDMSYVPLAIIAAYRMRFSELGRLDCSKHIINKVRDMI